MNKTLNIINFPCNYPIKVFGENNKDFGQIIIDIISKHCGKINYNQIRKKNSKNYNYIAYTVTIVATSKKQINTINQELQAHPLVKYLL